MSWVSFASQPRLRIRPITGEGETVAIEVVPALRVRRATCGRAWATALRKWLEDMRPPEAKHGPEAAPGHGMRTCGRAWAIALRKWLKDVLAPEAKHGPEAAETWFIRMESYAAFYDTLFRSIDDSRFFPARSLAGTRWWKLTCVTAWARAVLEWVERGEAPDRRSDLIIVLTYRTLLEHWDDRRVKSLVREYESRVLPAVAGRGVEPRHLWLVLCRQDNTTFEDRVSFLEEWLQREPVTEEDRISRLIALHQMVVAQRLGVECRPGRATELNHVLGLYVVALRSLDRTVIQTSLGSMVEADFVWLHDQLRKGDLSRFELSAVEAVLRRRLAVEKLVQVPVVLAAFVAVLLLVVSLGSARGWNLEVTASLLTPLLRYSEPAGVASPHLWRVRALWVFLAAMICVWGCRRRLSERERSLLQRSKVMAWLVVIGGAILLSARYSPLCSSVMFILFLGRGVSEARRIFTRLTAGAFVGWLFFYSGAVTDMVHQNVPDPFNSSSSDAVISYLSMDWLQLLGVTAVAMFGAGLLVWKFLGGAGVHINRCCRLLAILVSGLTLSGLTGIVLTALVTMLLCPGGGAPPNVLVVARWAAHVLTLGTPVALLVGVATQVLWQERPLLEEIGT